MFDLIDIIFLCSPFIFIALLIGGPIASHIFGKKQDEISRQLVKFVAENYNELAGGATLNYKGTSISRYSRLTRYRYCYSYIIMTSSRASGIYLADAVYSDEEAKKAKLTCQLITFFCGWWGFPWGIINSIKYLFENGEHNGTNDDTVGELMRRMLNS